MGLRPEQLAEGRVWAKIVGDPNGNHVELPVKRMPRRGGVLVAKSCTRCGHLRDADQYGLTGHSRSPDPTCKECHADAQRGSGNWRKNVESIRRADHKWQASTLPTATRRGQQWTGPELEIALRPDLTAVQAAKMIGRTKYAVQTIRARHKREILLQRIAGVTE